MYNSFETFFEKQLYEVHNLYLLEYGLKTLCNLFISTKGNISLLGISIRTADNILSQNKI